MDTPFFVVDAHQDIAWNMQSFGRDYTRDAAETRALEKNTEIPKWNYGEAMLGWDGYQQGRVGVVFATLFACPIRCQEGPWDTICYKNDQEAHKLYWSQAGVYDKLFDDHPDKFTPVHSESNLKAVLAKWQNAADGEQPPVGLVFLMEGAEGVREVEELEEWHAWGLRVLGPAWRGNHFCGGQNEPGPLTREGYKLLDVMADLNITLDLSHMDAQACLQALDHFSGRIIATHSNPNALVTEANSNRHLTNEVIEGILERDGVIGVVLYNGFLQGSWQVGDRRDLVTVERVVEHIDYYCQMAGDARHTGIGTDFDGGFGVQSAPQGLDGLGDLQKIAALLTERGYSEADITSIFSANWLRVLQETLPEN
jgi:membrane dipeptidase